MVASGPSVSAMTVDELVVGGDVCEQSGRQGKGLSLRVNVKLWDAVPFTMCGWALSPEIYIHQHHPGAMPSAFSESEKGLGIPDCFHISS